MQDPVQLHFEEHGSGAPLLLVHGFGASTFSWRHLVPELAKRHRVLLVDLRGFGESPKPEDDRYSIHEQVRLVIAFIRDHDLRGLILGGHSFGGGVALLTTLALLDDERYCPKRLILVDNVAYRQRLPIFMKLLRMRLIGPLGTLLPPKMQVRFVMEAAYHDDRLIPSEAVTAYSKALRTRGGRHALLQTARHMIPPDIDDLALRYGEIRLPVLILWGAHDEIVPIEVGRRLHEAIPGSSFVVVENCGHIPHEECPPVALRAVLDFLGDEREQREAEISPVARGRGGRGS
jgi:pimeloyl-ACP methyl ester carboxylesterase